MFRGLGSKNISDLVSLYKRQQTEDRLGKQNRSSKPVSAARLSTKSSGAEPNHFSVCFIQSVYNSITCDLSSIENQGDFMMPPGKIQVPGFCNNNS